MQLKPVKRGYYRFTGFSCLEAEYFAKNLFNPYAKS